MILKTYRMIAKGYGMLGKVLGIITAGVSVGTAVVEIPQCAASSCPAMYYTEGIDSMHFQSARKLRVDT